MNIEIDSQNSLSIDNADISTLYNDIIVNSQDLTDADNIYIGSPENDLLEGNTNAGVDILTGIEGKDQLVGADGVDRFLVGGTATIDFGDVQLTGETGQAVFYDEAGNDDYALISQFDSGQDVIELAGEKSEYSLGASPDGLPDGTGIFRGDELIGIVEGQNDLSLDADYFQASIV